MAKARREEIDVSLKLPANYTSLSRPGVFLLRMTIFLILACFVVAIINRQVVAAFQSNVGLNAVILGVLLIGIVYFYRQVMRLYPEISWVNSFRISDPGLAMERQPTLLAPMATMLRDRRGTLSLSPAAMRTFMDSISSRLDEARELSRYLVGLLVFLGLLGTFWGLLETLSSIAKTIAALDTKASESASLFEDLKAGLVEPLRGMGTAFSASLFGLSGSLVLGFLDLQAGQAQNRFYNELEEWLSHITELSPTSGTDMSGSEMAYVLAQLNQTVQQLNGAMASRAGAQLEGPPHAAGLDTGATRALQALAGGVEQLVQQMRTEQKVVREWVDEQAAQSAEISSVLRDLNATLNRGR